MAKELMPAEIEVDDLVSFTGDPVQHYVIAKTGNVYELEDIPGNFVESLLERRCPIDVCDGSGIIETTALDSDSHQYVPDGKAYCPCHPDHPANG